MRHEDHVDKVDKGRNRATKTSVFGEVADVAVNLYFFVRASSLTKRRFL